MSIYDKLQTVVNKLARPSKFGLVIRYFTNKTKSEFVDVNGFAGDDTRRRAPGRPGRRTDADFSFTTSKSQWLTAGPGQTAIVPEEGHTVRVYGKERLITGISESPVTYTFACTDVNR